MEICQLEKLKQMHFFFSTTRLSHQTENTLVWGNKSNEDMLLQDPKVSVNRLFLKLRPSLNTWTC